MADTILSSQGLKGFYKTPICKGLICSMLLTCTAIHIPFLAHLRQYLVCEIPQILASSQIWRLLLNRLTFVYTKDIICSALIIYYFRIFERRMGSRKFASYILSCSIFATGLEISVILLATQVYQNGNPVGGLLPPGLYSIIFPLYVNYFLDIPRVTVSSFLGIPLTGKILTYFLGLQLASSSPSTILASFTGILAGILHRQNFLGVQKWPVVPKWMEHLCDRAFGWILYSREPKERLPMGATLELQRQEEADRWEQQYFQNRARELRQNRGQGYSERLVDDFQQDGVLNFFRQRRPAASQRDPTGQGQRDAEVEPSDRNIQLLVDMGFDMESARNALRSAGDDLQTATSLLLRQ